MASRYLLGGGGGGDPFWTLIAKKFSSLKCVITNIFYGKMTTMFPNFGDLLYRDPTLLAIICSKLIFS